jgi:hypothetical protein
MSFSPFGDTQFCFGINSMSQIADQCMKLSLFGAWISAVVVLNVQIYLSDLAPTFSQYTSTYKA